MLRKRMLSLALVAGLAVFGAACEAEDEPAIEQDIQEEPADQTDLDVDVTEEDTGTTDGTGDTGTTDDTGDTGTTDTETESGG